MSGGDDQNDNGAPPETGFSALTPELLVSDIEQSLHHWCEIFGFEIAYQRPSERFAYLQRPEGAQVMLSQRHDDQKWETGPLAPPFGRGVMFQIGVADVLSIEQNLKAHAITPYKIPHKDSDGKPFPNPRKVWRILGDREGGTTELFALDPNGYLIMFSQSLGTRPLA